MQSRLVAKFAGAGFFVSLLAHFGTYLGYNTAEVNQSIWALHILAMLVFGLLVFSINGRYPKGNRDWKTVTAHYPLWARRLLIIAFGYVALNFMVGFCGEVGKAVPQRLTGTFVLYHTLDNGVNRSRVFVSFENVQDRKTVQLYQVPVLRETKDGISFYREVTEEEYYRRTLPILRMFTGHWMFFFLLPAFHFWFRDQIHT